MGSSNKVRARAAPRGVVYWLSHALVCLIVAPLIGIMVGIIGVFIGLVWGEIAAIVVLVLFMADLFVRLMRGRRPAVAPEFKAPSGALWDQQIDR